MSERTALLISSAVALGLIVLGSSLLLAAPGLDARLSLAIADSARASAVEPALVATTRLGDVWLWIAVASLILWSGEVEAGLTLCAALLGAFLTPVLKAAAAIPRPGTNLTSPVRAGGFSFPSGHAQLAAAVASVTAAGRERAAHLTLLAAAVLVGLSRVALGVHRVSDVVAGLGLGLLVGVGARVAGRRWMQLSAAARLRWTPAGPVFVAVGLLFGPATLHPAVAVAGGFLLGACLPPLYRLTDVRRDFSWRKLLVRVGIAAVGTTCLVVGHAIVGVGAKPLTAGLFGLWVTCLAPAAFQWAEGREGRR